jgi:hypothetical protein
MSTLTMLGCVGNARMIIIFCCVLSFVVCYLYHGVFNLLHWQCMVVQCLRRGWTIVFAAAT